MSGQFRTRPCIAGWQKAISLALSLSHFAMKLFFAAPLGAHASRLHFTNKSGDNHPVHLHRHTFEVTKVGDKANRGRHERYD